jgi:hypothetical protein
MRNLVLLLLGSLLSLSVSAQNIWTVNNQPSFNADFTSLQAALDSADAGDIIMLHGSSTSYGTIYIRKRIVLIGPGYFLGQNTAPNTQANPQTATIGTLYFQSNAAGTQNPSGSLVTGVTISNALYSSVASQTPINVTVQRCYIDYLSISNYVTAIFKENFINYTGNNGFGTCDIIGINSLQFLNNIIRRAGGGNPIIRTNANTSAVFKNNIIVGEGDDAAYSIDGSGCSFTNNLFLGDQNIVVTGTFGQVLNNMSTGTTFTGIATNIINIPGANLVIGWANPAGFSPDNRFTPKENAPSNGAGVGGENIGAFTNSSSYVLSGIPFVPNIYELDAPDFGTTGSGITINIKAKANN